MQPTSEGRKAGVSVDPRRLADLALAIAVRASCDAVFIEPMGAESYVVAFERDRDTIASLSIDATSGAATIARLAFVAELDLAANHATSAVVPVRSGDRHAEVVITVRPGDGLRADLMIVHKDKPFRASQTSFATTATGDVGDVLGNYKVVARLGHGGMGTVFRVEHVVLGRTYALKVLRAKVFEKDRATAQQFLREARAAARVRHPNIVDVFDFGRLPDGRPFFVMELVDGESLARRLAKGPQAMHDAVTIARQMANALAVVHDHGVIHADVTPSNVLVSSEDPLQVKLLDFGLAAIVGESVFDQEPTFVLGTPSYISPEQLRGLPPTDRSDQYSLGAVMFELLTGHRPYEHSDLREKCMMHLQAPIPVVTSPFGPLPPKLVDLVTTCLAKSPGARFPGMRAVIAALDEVDKLLDRRGWRKWLNG